MKGRVAFATLHDQLRALKLFENFIGSSTLLSRIAPVQTELFVADRAASGVSLETVNKDIRTLRGIFNMAIEPRGYLGEGQNPFAKIKKRKVCQKPVNYVSVNEYLALESAAKNIWWKALISMAYCSSLRVGEILNLTWADIDFERQQIHIVPKRETKETLDWKPKDHEKRVVPMSDASVKFFAELQAEAAAGHPYVFISVDRLKWIRQRQEGKRWNPKSSIVNNLLRSFDTIRRQAGVKDCTLHDLRRSAITNWAQKLPIQVVQQLAGHADVSTTQKYYLAVRPEDLASAGRILKSISMAQGND
jgi:integrase